MFCFVYNCRIFNFAGTIDLKDGTWSIAGAPANDESGTTFKFPAGVTGLRVHTATTTGASGTRAAGETSGRSTIRNLRIDGAYSSTEAEAHGIQLRAAAHIKNVIVSDFEGDGLFIVADAVGDGGNANNFLMEAVRAIRCRDGFFIDGADVNNGTFLGCDASANRRWGFNDSSFLGNSYIGCHAATNGRVAGAAPTGCTHGGNQYFVRDGQASGASTNAPTGTTADNIWWGYIGPGEAGTGIVPWSSGIAFREGGSYRTDNPNARNLVLNCYSEADQCPAQAVNPTLVIGGLHGAQVKGLAGYIRSEFNGLNVNALTSTGTLTGSNVVNGFGPQSGAAADSTLYLDSTSNFSNLQFRSWSAGVSSNDALIRGWRNTGLVLTAKAATHVGVDFVTGSLTIDSSGAYLTMPGGKLGYGDGAGGSVAQATSKSTGVTLHKPTGYITLHNAALAAGASVTFTLTNSLIGYRDQLSVTLRGSGTPGAYRVEVAEIAPAGGSCILRVINVSEASLSEAPLLNFMVLKGAQN